MGWEADGMTVVASIAAARVNAVSPKPVVSQQLPILKKGSTTLVIVIHSVFASGYLDYMRRQTCKIRKISLFLRVLFPTSNYFFSFFLSSCHFFNFADLVEYVVLLFCFFSLLYSC